MTDAGMRIAHVNTYDLTGGAARAAYRLHRGLVAEGVDSVFFVRSKASHDDTVRPLGGPGSILRHHANAAVLWPYRARREIFTTAPVPDRVIRDVAATGPDVIHLHWIAEGFVAPRSLRDARRPLVWTLHDTAAFTGGCHYPLDCRRYTDRCGACRALGSRFGADLSRLNWHRKRRALRHVDVTIVTPSRWMASCARESSLLRDRDVRVIPYGLDLQAFRPFPRELAREVLRIPGDRKYVLFIASGGASNPIKGLPHLAAALSALHASGRSSGIELLLAGGGTLPPGVELGVPVRAMGELRDDVSLAFLYSAANVVAVPSVQDNFPNTALEALACGRPVAGFRVGGLTDVVTDGVNGALAEPFDAAALSGRISWILESEPRWLDLSTHARQTAERDYALHIQARRYAELYRELVDRSRVERGEVH